MNLNDIFKKLDKFEESAIQIFILVATLIIYLLTKHWFFGVLVAVEFILFVALEIYKGSREHGIKKEILETIGAIVVVLIGWNLFSFLLNTPSPISAVVSCSMLPSINRGDLTIIRGVNISELNAIEIEINNNDFLSLFNYRAEIFSPFKNFSVNGSLYSYCLFYASVDKICTQFYSNPEKFVEKRGNLSFHYSTCKRKKLGTNQSFITPCITSISYNEKSFKIRNNYEVIVFQPKKYELFALYGDIIHRVQVKLKLNSSYYILTKGDNNDIFDIQFYDYRIKRGNLPVEGENIKGVKILLIPYLGYFKLFISGFVEEPEHCTTILEN